MNMFIFKWKRTDFRKKVNTVLSFFAQFIKNSLTYCNKKIIFTKEMFFLKNFFLESREKARLFLLFSVPVVLFFFIGEREGWGVKA